MDWNLATQMMQWFALVVAVAIILDPRDDG